MSLQKNITIIIPVYGDWDSLKLCIAALKKHTPTTVSKTLFVNDCGPDADLMEKNILKTAKSLPGFEYHRNTKNLGFVKTCNRAVLVLDKSQNDVLLLNSDAMVTEGFLEEMQAVLNLDDKNGTVSPRSNSAANYSIPLRTSDGKPFSMDESHILYKKIKGSLPRYYVTPDSHGFCILIRRSLINKIGLFDEIYGRGNGEETDFCLRAARAGYKSLVANHAYVQHFHSRSFSAAEKDVLKERNLKIVNERYPELQSKLEEYINNTIDPVDWFADLIAGQKNQFKAMIDLTHMPQAHDQNADNITSILKFISTHQAQKITYTIVTNPDVDKYYKLSQYGLRVVFMGGTQELFHVGFCPYTILYPNNLNSLNKMCLKIIFSNDDLPKNKVQHSVFKNSLSFSDDVVVSGHKATEELLNIQAETDNIYKAELHRIDDAPSTLEYNRQVAKLLEKRAKSKIDEDRLRKRWIELARSSKMIRNKAPGKIQQRLSKLKAGIRTNFKI